MMCQNYQSVPVPYRTTSELGPTLFPDAPPYWIIPAPYAERLQLGAAATGLWVDGDRVIMSAITDLIYWPSYEFLRWEFAANSGAFIERGPFVGYPYAEDVNQGANGELYMTYATGQVYPLGGKPGYEILTDEEILPATYGYVSFTNGVFFDRPRNRAVFGGQSSAKTLRVFEFVSGTHLRDLVMPAAAVNIVHDQGTRVYVLLENKAVICIDYETGQVFSYIRLPQITSVIYARIAWDKSYRRLLVCEFTADNVDGTATTVIKGYRYVPIPVHACKPIPLKRLRDGVKSPVLLKQIGDMGEGIVGLATVGTTDTSGTITRTDVALDGDGEGVAEITGIAEGNETVDITVEAACLL